MSHLSRILLKQDTDPFLNKWIAHLNHPLGSVVQSELEIGDVDIQLKSYIDRILGNERVISDISKNSFHHSNGFKKITLWSGLKGEKIRLHFWPKSNIESCDIHNHFWNFSSLVVYGRLKLENYIEVDLNGIEVNKYTLEPLTVREHSFTHNGCVKLRMKNQTIVSKGGSHSLIHCIPHRICSDETDSVTFLLQGPRIKGVRNHIYSNRQMGTSKTFSQKTMTTNDVYSTLQNISDGIEKN